MNAIFGYFREFPWSGSVEYIDRAQPQFFIISKKKNFKFDHLILFWSFAASPVKKQL
jgi:hypothetical protein